MNNNPPHRDTIRVLMKKFEETGSLLDVSLTGRPVSVTDQTTKDEVSLILKKKPQTSIRTFELTCSMISFCIHCD